MKKLSLKDVAQHVGVSTALVSYVLNGQAVEKQVNKDTAERIMAAIEELNYTPNQIAKSLKMRTTNTIGLVVADINYRFSTGITRAIESESKKRNYTVIYGSSNEDENKFSELIDVFVNRRVDGLILIPSENSQDQIRALQKSEIPFVLIDRIFPNIKTNYISLDNFKASYKATEYLIKLGHKRIAFINYKTTMFHLQERTRGFREALSDHKLTIAETLLPEILSANLAKDIQQAIDNVLHLQEPCDAIFFATDTLTIHGLKYLNKLKIKVPGDISVLSFDGSDAFELFYCPITHSKQPLEEMGKLAVNTLLDLVNHSKINMQISLDADIVIGNSCGESV
ncbi:transcriptional regulator, LacI family [Mucilaginibacter pineti]|uniref:Transcriptional regulator, LacI family n=1 Tax=Mucilaginibacter pineti TaxID=1391627 RepID=A0A1G7M2P8_9SPHI|nr:substrate-binding domain-containing protein [Mucilaginibacter pineti]SDF56072.1 transcriptional regulator, LacI family [Mucilaginibacter pineti]